MSTFVRSERPGLNLSLNPFANEFRLFAVWTTKTVAFSRNMHVAEFATGPWTVVMEILGYEHRTFRVKEGLP
jgi:hypothetical protein